jgi:hypothetical protein
MSGSPLKRNGLRGQFSESLVSDADYKTTTPAKHQSDRVRDLVGRNHVNPASKSELASMDKQYGSPEK